jgi:uncharacterized MnhB-related membrane protein
MKIIIISISIFIIASAIGVLSAKTIKGAVLIFCVLNLFSSILFIIMGFYDIAILQFLLCGVIAGIFYILAGRIIDKDTRRRNEQ